MPETLHCWVYRSHRARDTYLYLREEAAFDLLPPPLLRMLGGLDLVMSLQLFPGRKLARSDPAEVMKALREQGFYLQMPPPPDDPE